MYIDDEKGSSARNTFAGISEAKVNKTATKVNMLESCGNTKNENKTQK